MWSTSSVGPDQAFDYWHDLICDAFVQLSASPKGRGSFAGDIEHHELEDVGLSVVSADGQRVDRTRDLIARSHEDYLLASIQLEGAGRVHQDGRAAGLTAGTMAFYDSTRPYTLDFDHRFRQLVVQVPKSAVGLGRTLGATAVALDPTGAGRLASDFFVGLAREHALGHSAPALAQHAIGLFEFALGLAASTAPTATGTDAAVLERIRTTIARAAGDPELGADDVAAACHVSRRTLFRVLAADGCSFRDLLRHERVRRAKALLRADEHLPVAVVAARSGFAGPAQFHRTFRDAVGVSPGAYRGTR
ncbi:helix-turn-helix domain-containing protein [Actinomycetospora atypica]|uniref:Helix-turn-helix domain-containing protein n=1 Tax=Actinomycetospora atypica TaxID=1290095 RepID=A0ABV9YT95_9PSEU